MAFLMLCIAFCCLQTLSDAHVPTYRLPSHVLMTAIIEVDQPPVRLDMLAVRWEHDGRPVSEYKDQKLTFHNSRAQMPLEQFKDGNISLTLDNVTMSDSGNYTCLIQYGEQQEKVQYRLIIETHRLRLLNLSSKKTAVPADQLPFLQMGGYPNMYARPGQQVTLKCRFNTDPSMELPMLTVRWSKDGVTKWFYNGTYCSSQDIQEDELAKGKADLYLGQVQEKDSGTYSCSIKYRTLERSYKTVLTVRDGAVPVPRSMQHPHQSEDPASEASVTVTGKYWTTKITLVCVVVVSTYFFVFIIFFCIP